MSNTNNAVVSNETKIELLAEEKRTVHILLSEAQQKALVVLDKWDERQTIAEACVASRIKGAFKSRAEGIEKELSKHYDVMSRSMKLPITKDDYIKHEMEQVRGLLRSL